MTSNLEPVRLEEMASFDHAVITVPDLDTAIANFRSLGFQVQRGGTNGPVHNALIFFQDGTYIELITPVSKRARIFFRLLYYVGNSGLVAKYRPTITTRFLLWFGGPSGLRDWCVRCTDLDKAIENFQSKGIETTDAQYFARKRPDGEVAEWRLAGPTNRRLPFMIEDISPTQIRVPLQSACEHPNGVSGISAVVLPRDIGLNVVANLRRCFNGKTTGSEDYMIGSVTIHLSENPSALDLALELRSNGEVKGPFPGEQTYGALITVI